MSENYKTLGEEVMGALKKPSKDAQIKTLQTRLQDLIGMIEEARGHLNQAYNFLCGEYPDDDTEELIEQHIDPAKDKIDHVVKHIFAAPQQWKKDKGL